MIGLFESQDIPCNRIINHTAQVIMARENNGTKTAWWYFYQPATTIALLIEIGNKYVALIVKNQIADREKAFGVVADLSIRKNFYNSSRHNRELITRTHEYIASGIHCQS